MKKWTESSAISHIQSGKTGLKTCSAIDYLMNYCKYSRFKLQQTTGFKFST
jgi:hypothetical protein